MDGIPGKTCIDSAAVHEFLQQLINGLSLGAIYALIALGYSMVYGVLKFINFAHGDVLMIGAFAGFYAAPLIHGICPILGRRRPPC